MNQTKVTTTAKIRELLKQAKKLPWVMDKDYDTFSPSTPQDENGEGNQIDFTSYGSKDLPYIVIACNNAARMAELLERVEDIIKNYEFRDNKRWLADFQKFQDGENG